MPQKTSIRKLEVILPLKNKLQDLSHSLTGQGVCMGEVHVCAIDENQLKKNNKSKYQSITIDQTETAFLTTFGKVCS